MQALTMSARGEAPGNAQPLPHSRLLMETTRIGTKAEDEETEIRTGIARQGIAKSDEGTAKGSAIGIQTAMMRAIETAIALHARGTMTMIETSHTKAAPDAAVGKETWTEITTGKAWI